MPLHEEHCSKPYCQLTNEELANPYLVIEELFDLPTFPMFGIVMGMVKSNCYKQLPQNTQCK